MARIDPTATRVTFGSMDPKEDKRKERSSRTASKGKLTLSVSPEHVAMLRKAGARRGRSITELVEELAMDLDRTTQGTGKVLWADRMNGKAEQAFTASDYERTDLLGALLRKHLPRQRLKE
jgi:hypothetical protein